jgi:cell division protein ZapA
MENKKQSVMVNIFGEDYPIRSDVDNEYTRKIATYLDRKMKEVAEGLPSRTYSKVAVLAAMNIADELFKEKIDKENKLSQVEEKAQTLLKWLDDSLREEA